MSDCRFDVSPVNYPDPDPEDTDLHSLISVFIVLCLDSIIHLISISEISGFQLTSVAEQTKIES